MNPLGVIHRLNIEAAAREAAHAYNDKDYATVEKIHAAVDLMRLTEEEYFIFAAAYVKARMEG